MYQRNIGEKKRPMPLLKGHLLKPVFRFYLPLVCFIKTKSIWIILDSSRLAVAPTTIFLITKIKEFRILKCKLCIDPKRKFFFFYLNIRLSLSNIEINSNAPSIFNSLFLYRLMKVLAFHPLWKEFDSFRRRNLWHPKCFYCFIMYNGVCHSNIFF